MSYMKRHLDNKIAEVADATGYSWDDVFDMVMNDIDSGVTNSYETEEEYFDALKADLTYSVELSGTIVDELNAIAERN